MENIFLVATDLASKWGFSDGDLFYDEMIDYARERSLFATNYEFHENNELFSYSNYFDQRKLLLFFVINNFGKDISLDKRFSFERVLTSHNPIRVYHKNQNDESTQEVFDTAISELEDFLSNIKDIEIDEKMIDNACDKLFPYRSNAWLAFFNMLHFNSEALNEYISNTDLEGSDYDKLLNSTQSTFFTNLTNKLIAGYDELTIQLAAELLYNSNLEDTKYLDIYDTLNKCKELIYK